MSSHTQSRQAPLDNGALLDSIIGKLLGQGLGYGDWKRHLENLAGLTWTDSLKNTIIKKEFSFFREEILRLMSEPNTARGLKSKTNSLESILKRLQGLEWFNGMPNEMEQRKHDGRLLGKDAKARCLQYHVARWKAESASASQPLLTVTTSNEDHEAIPKTMASKTISSSPAPTVAPAAVYTSPTKSATTAHSLNNSMFPDSDSFIFRKPVHTLKADMPLMFRNEIRLPDLDPTLHGDYEIPWIPRILNQETESYGAEITLEEVFRFFDENPNFPIEPSSNEPSFELPRRHGINDSYSTYIHQITENLNTQRSILEEILDSYGSQPSKDTWMRTLARESTNISSNSEFKQQHTSTEITAFSQEKFGISTQDIAHNDYRSDAYANQFSHCFDTEALAFGNTFPSESVQVEDQEANMCPSRYPNEPATLAPSIEKITSQASRRSEQASDRSVDPRNDLLYHIQLKLCKKKDELAVARATVSNILTEIKLLEDAAKQSSQHSKGMPFKDPIRYKNSHKRHNDEILHGAKRLKERATASSFDSEISEVPNVNGEEKLPPTDLHFSAAKDPLPPMISTAGENAHQPSNQDNHERVSDCLTIPAISTSGAAMPSLGGAVQNLGQSSPHTINETYPREAIQHVETNSIVHSLSTHTQWSERVNESRKMFSRDSDHAYLDIGPFNCRASCIEDLGQSTAWLA